MTSSLTSRYSEHNLMTPRNTVLLDDGCRDCTPGSTLHELCAEGNCILQCPIVVLQELGIPTANLDRDSLHGALAQAVSGIYLGWASVGTDAAVHKMVMSIGWNPYYKNEASCWKG